MNTMYRCASRSLAAALVAISVIAPVSAQVQRAFPTNTLRGAMVFGEYPQVTLNGRSAQLSPGSRVRDQDNRIVLAASLTGARMLVHYTVGIGGAQVQDVWILRPEEAAIRPWPSTLEEAQTWTYDPATFSWTRP
jgi:hypothetical protein